MRLAIVFLLLLAIAGAGGTVYLAKAYLKKNALKDESNNITVTSSDSITHVLIANKDLAAGTAFNSSHYQWQKWPLNAVKSNFITSDDASDKEANSLEDMLVRFAIPSGAPITKQMLFKRGSGNFLPGKLNSGMRAMAIAVTPDSSVSGFITPGDKVDVLLTVNVKSLISNYDSIEGQNTDSHSLGLINFPAKFLSETILSNLLVLGIDQKVNDLGGKAKISKTIILEVSPKQSEILSLAKSLGKINLSLRAINSEPELIIKSSTSDTQISQIINEIVSASKSKVVESIPININSPDKPKLKNVEKNTKSRNVRIFRGSDKVDVKEFRRH